MSYEFLDKAVIDGIEWALVKTCQTKHFKNGKANLHVEVNYSVEVTVPEHFTPGIEMSSDRALAQSKQRFWIKSKAEATKYFKSLKSSAVVVERSGAEALKRLFG